VTHDKARKTGRVLISGMGIICSIAHDAASFSKALREGQSGIECVPYTGEQQPAFSAEIRNFDFLNAVKRREALPEQLLIAAQRAGVRLPFALQAGIVAALEAWETAGLHQTPIPEDHIGLVVAGNNLTGKHAYTLYPKFLKNPSHLPGSSALRLQDTDHVGVLTEMFRIRGEGYTVGGASASGNIGIINACRLIELGAVNACLVVGALTDLSSLEKQAYFNIGAMAAQQSGDPKLVCRPFDEEHRGFVYGQGAACLILEGENSVQRRKARILAELMGYDLKLDANSSSDPREEGEALVMKNAICRAALDPGDITYVNAHGTGAPLGDSTELRALHRVLEGSFTRTWVNATKSLTGHCLCAAAVIEAVATIVQMAGNFVHPNINLSQAIDPDCRLVGARSEVAKIDFALSNSFGFGGFNTSIVLASPNR
jgi:malonyl-[acp] decarboxylase